MLSLSLSLSAYLPEYIPAWLPTYLPSSLLPNLKFGCADRVPPRNWTGTNRAVMWMVMSLDWGMPETSSRGCLFQEPPRCEGVRLHKAPAEISFSFFCMHQVSQEKMKNRGDNFENELPSCFFFWNALLFVENKCHFIIELSVKYHDWGVSSFGIIGH